MVKQQLSTGKVAKAKKLSSEESEGSSEEVEVKKGKSDKKVVEKGKASKPTAKVLDSDSDVPKKKLPSTKAGKKVSVPSSSESEEPKSSKKAKKSKKAKDDSSDSDKKKKKSKKVKEDSSDSDKKKKSKKSKGKVLNSSEEESAKGKKKAQKKTKQDSSSEDLKNKKKGKKVSSSEEEVKKPVAKGKKIVKSDTESESSSVKKPKSAKVPEPVKKAEPAKKPEPAKKVEPVKKAPVKKSDSESESSEEPVKKPAKDSDSESESEKKPAIKSKAPVTKKMDIDSESGSESEKSKGSANSSDEDEEELNLKKKKKLKEEKKNKEKTLPIKKKPAEAAAEPIAAIKKVSETDVAINLRETELFIGGLAYEATEDDIFAAFSKYGEIDTITLPMNNGTPRGIAFVNFKNPQQAAAALVLNDTEFMNRRIRVNFSSQKPDRKPLARTGGFGAGPSSSSATVFVGNLPYDANEDSIREFFGMCGEIKQVRIAKSPEGEVKGFGHVEFVDKNAASEAVKLAGNPMGGRALRIDFAAEKAPGGRGFPPRDAPQRSNAPSQSFAGKKIKL